MRIVHNAARMGPFSPGGEGQKGIEAEDADAPIQNR